MNRTLFKFGDIYEINQLTGLILSRARGDGENSGVTEIQGHSQSV